MYRALFSLTTLMLAACASGGGMMNAGDAPVDTRQTSLGKVLTDADGMTLYTFGRDEPGQSNCYGGCAEAWPPLQAAPGAEAGGDFSIIERDGGGQQWAYQGDPLYLWVQDSQPGDVTGHEVNDIWFVVPMDGGDGGY